MVKARVAFRRRAEHRIWVKAPSRSARSVVAGKRGTRAMRKLGIIGGTSWASTALYYDHINRGIAQRLGGLHSARLILESFDFAEYSAFHKADDWKGANIMVVDAAKRLA